MTAFFTCCAFTRPSTSVRKSSRRSDQRRPPRATGPKRKMHPLHARRPDEDFAVGFGGGQVVQLARRHLERDVGLGLPVLAGLVIVGPLHRLHQKREAAQHPVGVKAFHRLQGLDDLGEDRVRLFGAEVVVGGDGRVELHAEQVEDQPRYAGIGAEGFFLHALAGVEARLQPVAGESAHQRRLAPGHPKLQHQPVEAVALGAPGPDGDEGVLEGP